MGLTALFGTIHGSHYIISANFYIYLQYFQQKIFSFSKISRSQTDSQCSKLGSKDDVAPSYPVILTCRGQGHPRQYIRTVWIPFVCPQTLLLPRREPWAWD